MWGAGVGEKSLKARFRFLFKETSAYYGSYSVKTPQFLEIHFLMSQADGELLPRASLLVP